MATLNIFQGYYSVFKAYVEDTFVTKNSTYNPYLNFRKFEEETTHLGNQDFYQIWSMLESIFKNVGYDTFEV